MEEYLEFAIDIAKHAGEVMLKYFNIDNEARYKADNTIVTIADTEINSYLIDRVKEKYPTHAVDGEEEQFEKSNYVWVCDPIDGTAMYARHIPVAVFSLALVIDGEPVVGVVYDPFTDIFYTAIKGKGAYINGKKMSVNDIQFGDKRSISHMDVWPACEYNIYDILEELGQKTYFVSIGTIARACMCIANGDFNMAICPITGHKNCDVAAAKIIVEEAGGKVTNLFGKEQRYDRDVNGVIVSNGLVHQEVIDIVNKYIESKY